MTNSIIMNSTSVGFGAVMSETTGDYTNLLITIAVAVLSELIKYAKSKRKGVTSPTVVDKVNKAKPWVNLLSNLLSKKNGSNNGK